MAGLRPHRNRLRWIAASLTLAAATVLPSSIRAQERAPLKLSIKPTVDVMRSNAPLLLDATLTWSSPRLLEGRLELDLYVGQQRVAAYRSREVALSASKVTLPLMLPPVAPPDEKTACTLQARFEGPQESIELGGYDVAAPVLRRRVLVVGLVVTEDSPRPPGGIQAPEDQPFALQESLRIESRLTREDLLRDVQCRVVEVLVDSLPECGLELCGYDLLIVTREGLDALRTDQLAAIADWVEAGASACVVATAMRDTRRQALLRRIAGESAIDPVLKFDVDGTPRLLRSGDAGWRRGAPGIGRSIVAVSPIDVASSAWQREVCYLLGVRASLVDDVLSADQAPSDRTSDEGYEQFDPGYQPFRPHPVADEERLPMLLLPEKVEGVPLYVVCGLLAGCLLAVAPGEYFLLGMLRRRRWTWIVFPCTALGCTLFMIGLAQSYVGNADHATSLTFVDLAEDGRAVRTSQFELTFTATERLLEAPIEQRFVVALDPARWRQKPDDLEPWRPVQPQPPPMPTLFDVSQAPFVYEGRSPVSYTLSRPMRQWSPRLARWTAFGRQAATAPSLPGIDWSAPAVKSLADQSAQRLLAARVRQTAPAAHVLVASKLGSPLWLNAEQPGFAPGDPTESIARVVLAASARERAGLFKHLAVRAPTCAADMEDLALLDPADPRQTLVVVLVSDGQGNYTAYRRLERGLE